ISPFVIQPTSAVVTEGSVARFACRITANPPPIITWEFNRVTLPLATERITALPNGVLQIQGVEREDAGNYRCVATNIASRRRSTEATLVVNPAPAVRHPQRPQIIAGPQNITTTIHQNAILECVATGRPKPLISWSRADHKSIDVFNTRVLGNGNLVISDVKPQHAGVYVCRATTPGTRNYTIAIANLTVLAPPSLVEWPESLTRPRAGTARFVCQAEGVPPPHITWLKNGEKVHSNGRIKMYNSKLVINQIIPEDDAIYQCQAENEQGSVLSTARLIVVMSEDRPSAPRNVRAETVSSSAILLAWDRPLYNSDKVIAYSVHYMKAEGLNNEEYQVVIGNDTTRYIIDDLEPANNYTFYIVAYMPMGASRMSDHVIQHTLEDVPLAPELQLEALNCTTVLVRWQPSPDNSGAIQGYRLYYREESQPESTPVLLHAQDTQRTIGGLDPRRKYHVKLLAYSFMGEGYQADQTVSTPSCVSVRDRMVPPPPPPHHVYAKANSSTAVYLHWGRPMFTTGQAVNYTIRCNPVGLQNASLVLYLQTAEQSQLVTDLEPNTRYEFAVRLHVDQLSSPWSPVVYQSTLPEAPTKPPSSVKVTLIEDSTALVSWKQPEEPNVVVTHYTILYASRTAWVAGEWQVLQREGSITMALLENLQLGNIYLVKISASNQVGDGPFSNVVELAVLPGGFSSGRHTDGSAETEVFTNAFYHLDQRSMTGIIVGVSIALACIIICVLILVYRGKAGYTMKPSTTKNVRQRSGQGPHASASQAHEDHPINIESLVPIMSNHFVDTKVQRSHVMCTYQPGLTVLTYKEAPPSSPHQASPLQVFLGPPRDTEASQNSEGSHETGDSGRYSHNEMELTQLSSSGSLQPPCLGVSRGDSHGSADELPHLAVQMEIHQEAPSDPYQLGPDPSLPRSL
ncbi:hypothetical protein Z043_104754, partial [Scleropages formosus]